jgi:hypothetical protein
MLSKVIRLSKKESMMKQLYFEFAREMDKQIDIELNSDIEEKLIEQMAVLLIQVNKREINENDDFTDK